MSRFSIGLCLILLITVSCEQVGAPLGIGADDDNVDPSPVTEEAFEVEEAVEQPTIVERSNDPVDDDITLALRLGVIEGQMFAFVELYRVGDFQTAKAHLLSADDKLYVELMPAFAARGLPGFAGSLAQLNAESEKNEDIEHAYSAFEAELRANQPVLSVRDQLLASSELMRMAKIALEASVASDRQTIIDQRKFQDAYGMMRIARNGISELQTSDINESEAIAVAHEQMDLLADLLPAMKVDKIEGDATMISAAADQIERIASRLG